MKKAIYRLNIVNKDKNTTVNIGESICQYKGCNKEAWPRENNEVLQVEYKLYFLCQKHMDYVLETGELNIK
jgi:hypothetical protein